MAGSADAGQGKDRSADLERTFKDPVTAKYRAPECELWDIAQKYPEHTKWHHYYEIYDEMLAPYRGKPVKLLEIGVFKCGSMRMWQEFLGPDAVVVGIDNNEEARKYGDGLSLEIGEQQDYEFLDKVVEKHGKFDVIIDDGSHVWSHQRETLTHLFRYGLVENGLYVVEDTHTSFWGEWADSGFSFLQTAMQLVFLMHAQYEWKNLDDFDVEDLDKYEAFMEWWEAYVHSVQFFDSIVAIRKRLKPAQVSKTLWWGGE